MPNKDTEIARRRLSTALQAAGSHDANSFVLALETLKSADRQSVQEGVFVLLAGLLADRLDQIPPPEPSYKTLTKLIYERSRQWNSVPSEFIEAELRIACGDDAELAELIPWDVGMTAGILSAAALLADYDDPAQEIAEGFAFLDSEEF